MPYHNLTYLIALLQLEPTPSSAQQAIPQFKPTPPKHVVCVYNTTSPFKHRHVLSPQAKKNKKKKNIL